MTKSPTPEGSPEQVAQVSFRHMPHSNQIESLCHTQAEKLFRLSSRLTRCQVVIDGRPNNDGKSVAYRVNLTLSLPGDEIAIHEEADRDQEEASGLVRNAYNAARRIVLEHAERRRNRARQPDE